MTNPKPTAEEAKREFAKGWGNVFEAEDPDDAYSEFSLTDKNELLLFDLNALLDEHYVPKEAFIALENVLAKTEAALLKSKEDIASEVERVIEERMPSEGEQKQVIGGKKPYKTEESADNTTEYVFWYDEQTQRDIHNVIDKWFRNRMKGGKQ